MSPRDRFLYSGIRVRNLARSLAFYRKIGFRVHARGTMGHGGLWVHLMFPKSRHRLELNYYPARNRFFEPFRRGTEFDHFGFYVEDPVAWKRRALRAGGILVSEFVDGTTRLVYVRDPNGVWLEGFGPAQAARRRVRRRRPT